MPETANDLVLTQVQDAVGIITINRPKTLNALNVETLLALETALTGMEQDPQVRVIVLTGAGDKAFVATNLASKVSALGVS